MKKIILITVLALFVGACGGSDASTTSADELADDFLADEGVTPPPITESDAPSTQRDCEHSAAALASADGDADVELPPAEKPEVASEFLVDVDELIVTDLITGTGDVATAGTDISMQYVGVLAKDGTQFDASWDRGAQPFDFQLGGGMVIAGWDQGIEGMQVGGRRVLQIPSDLAYGDNPRGDVIGAGDDLVFIVDLVAAGPSAPPVPADTLGEFSELQTIDLVVGEGCEAQYGDIISVNYVGVDAIDGIEFDSSWGRGVPFEVIVGRSTVIDGWNAGFEGMRVGGERILQIPSDQAYDEGDLVFRVHLEELVEAPLAHTLRFDGDVPDDIEITTLVEGSGPEANESDVINANAAIIIHNSGIIAQSSWQTGQTAQIALSGSAQIAGLEESIVGIKAGEVRQIIIPAESAYPDGVPEGAGIEEGDALVFIIAPLDIVGG